MAAPTYVNASTGSTDPSGAWTHTCAAPAAAGNLIVVQVFIAGTATGTPTIDSVTNAQNINGSTPSSFASTFKIAGQLVGTATLSQQYVYFFRSTGTSAPVITGSNSGGDDVYVRAYEFANVSTGTTLATIIENIGGTSNLYLNGRGESTTAADTAVTTNGVDRLALNCCAIDDNIAIGQFTGMTGGTWSLPVASYNTATGTNGGIVLQTAAMATAGTIDGGTVTITSGPWGVVGFALIGTTVSGTTYTKAGYGVEHG